MKIFGKERDYVIHDAENIKGFFGYYRFLSNFHKCVIHFDNHVFSATENAYMYAKMPDSGQQGELAEELLVCEPSRAKKIGREVQLRGDWDKIKLDVMSAVCFDKFYRHLDLRKELLATGHKYLEETNHWNDVFWGICDGKGKNNLGKVLMGIRTYWAGHYPDLLDKKKVTELF